MILKPVTNREPACDVMISASPDVLRHWASLIESRVKNINSDINQHTPVVTLQVAPGIKVFCDPKDLDVVPSVIKTQPDSVTDASLS